MKYNTAVYIGRFQPFHNGHVSAIAKCLEIADHVVVLIGSANSPRTVKNPFTYEERVGMIKESHIGDNDKIFIRPLKDFRYDETRWIQEVQHQVYSCPISTTLNEQLHGRKIVLVGMDKDESTYYLRLFPTWDFISHDRDPKLDATSIRKLYFEDTHTSFWSGTVPRVTNNFLTEFKLGTEWTKLQEEYEFDLNYDSSKFNPIFATTDAVVVQSGHVLLVQRGTNPGKGLWALPGGFVGQKEKLFDACIRELYEETNIKVQEQIMRRNCVDSKVYDDPNRDTRARIITHAYLFKLDDAKPLPKVKGADDAEKAWWFSLDEFENMESEVYSDHWHIVKSLT